MSKIFIVLFFMVLTSTVDAVEFKPYPSAKITHEQWVNYYNKVSVEHKNTVQIIKEQSLEIYNDEVNKIMIAFTQEGHPAHPAWISRKPVEKNGFINIRTIGYFAGEEPPFAVLYKQYLALNNKVKEHINK